MRYFADCPAARMNDILSSFRGAVAASCVPDLKSGIEKSPLCERYIYLFDRQVAGIFLWIMRLDHMLPKAHKNFVVPVY
jgi:hypothetical protein